jgi:hypothetical protein
VAIWTARDTSLYAALLSGTHHLAAAINSTLFVGVGVNVQTPLALLLFGFFASSPRC